MIHFYLFILAFQDSFYQSAYGFGCFGKTRGKRLILARSYYILTFVFILILTTESWRTISAFEVYRILRKFAERENARKSSWNSNTWPLIKIVRYNPDTSSPVSFILMINKVAECLFQKIKYLQACKGFMWADVWCTRKYTTSLFSFLTSPLGTPLSCYLVNYKYHLVFLLLFI